MYYYTSVWSGLAINEQGLTIRQGTHYYALSYHIMLSLVSMMISAVGISLVRYTARESRTSSPTHGA